MVDPRTVSTVSSGCARSSQRSQVTQVSHDPSSLVGSPQPSQIAADDGTQSLQA
jgi:hypothetical protein